MVFSMVRTCDGCGAKNRIPARHLADSGRCGSCHASLPPVSEPIDVDSASFDDIAREARVPLLVDFWAEWCGPCRMAAPHVHGVAREMTGRALVLKVNSDLHPDLSARFGVRAIPTFVVIRNGHTIFQRSGVVPRSEMRHWLEDAEQVVRSSAPR